MNIKISGNITYPMSKYHTETKEIEAAETHDGKLILLLHITASISNITSFSRESFLFLIFIQNVTRKIKS